MALNPQQEEAANSREGAYLVTAVPGSGKTRIIEERTERLINGGVAPSSLLLISFTNKAADEMKTRIMKRVGDAGKSIEIMTFHKLCSRILRRSGAPIGYGYNMTIIDDKEQVDLMSQVARAQEMELTKPQIKKIIWALNDSRENLESDDEMFKRFKQIDENFYYVAKEYVKRLLASNSCDFSSLLSECHRLLKTCPDVLERIHQKVKYLMCDEIQDTNFVQFSIVELLAKTNRNVFCVGDLDQSIYAFRGARPENVKDFLRAFPEAKQIRLGKNYRSTPQIIFHSDKLIKHNPDRFDGEFTTDNPSGQPVLVKGFDNQNDEARWVAQTTKTLIASGQFKPKDIAVLFRINSMSRAIEVAMRAAGVPHVVKGAFSFFDRREIKDIMAMLRFLVNPKCGISFHRIANKPGRHLGDVTIGRIEKIAETLNVDMLEACRSFNPTSSSIKDGLHEVIAAFSFDYSSMTIPEVIDHLYNALRYDEYLKEEADEYVERKDNVDELIKDALRFNNEKGNDIVAYLESMALISDGDDDKGEDTVKLSSGHSAKGLEWGVVFGIGMNQGILPHKRAIDESPEAIFEERRIAYTIFTRAKLLLCTTYVRRQMDLYAAKGGKTSFKEVEPSQFLIEAQLLKPLPKKPVKKNYGRDHEELPENY